MAMVEAFVRAAIEFETGICLTVFAPDRMAF